MSEPLETKPTTLADLILGACENFDDNYNDCGGDEDGLATVIADEQTPATVEEMMKLDSADVWRMLDTKVDADALLETGFDVLKAAVYNEIKAGVLAHYAGRVERGEITFEPAVEEAPRPLRTSYLHMDCGTITELLPIFAQSFTTERRRYTHVHCTECGQRPVIEFHWIDPETGDTSPDVVGS